MLQVYKYICVCMYYIYCVFSPSSFILLPPPPYHFFDIGNKRYYWKQSPKLFEVADLGKWFFLWFILLFLFLLHLLTNTRNHPSGMHHHIISALYVLDHCSILLLKKIVAGNYIIALAFIFILPEDIFWQWFKKQINIFFQIMFFEE